MLVFGYNGDWNFKILMLEMDVCSSQWEGSYSLEGALTWYIAFSGCYSWEGGAPDEVPEKAGKCHCTGNGSRWWWRSSLLICNNEQFKILILNKIWNAFTLDIGILGTSRTQVFKFPKFSKFHTTNMILGKWYVNMGA